MSSDPAFLFYPGDYLRDTQCLSEKVQVAYDRIICEHMRNICIRQKQLNFFTKRLSEDEKDELLMVLTKVDGGYQIKWVAESIIKRRTYSESRRQNRLSKINKDMSNISQSYDKHMDNENENIIIYDNVIKDIVFEFYKFQSVNHKNQLNEWESNEALLNDSYDVIEKLHRIDKFSYDEIMLVLKNTINDNFWQDQIISLRGLRNKGKNGQMKFQNAAAKLLKKNVFDEWEERYGKK